VPAAEPLPPLFVVDEPDEDDTDLHVPTKEERDG
jgi:hypothetical protein